PACERRLYRKGCARLLEGRMKRIAVIDRKKMLAWSDRDHCAIEHANGHQIVHSAIVDDRRIDLLGRSVKVRPGRKKKLREVRPRVALRAYISGSHSRRARPVPQKRHCMQFS